MKIKLIFALLLLTVINANAQEDVTKFMGIPIDGYKKDMIHKLEQKGFDYDATEGFLSGEFNGKDVNIYVVTNNNKVYRIMVSERQLSNEADIKIRFNNLCRQFEKNQRYTASSFFQEISDDEDISYQMGVKNKRFEASFYQTPKDEEVDYNKIVWFMINEHYGRYYINIYYDNVYNQANGDDL